MLVDSHALLWFLAGDEQLGASNRAHIESGATVSAACIWEIAIKVALGKLDAPGDLPDRVLALGFEVLPITADHGWQVKTLPPHHRDPFDRMLIAQAQVESLPILTVDSAFSDYDVAVIWGHS
jgi:PIN domain nuclease of toxin-antitoxin system